MIKSQLSFLFFFLIASAFTLSAQGTQLLRQPTISKSQIVFVYANDLWIVARDGGDARRLTSNEGQESFPHFSPDEKYIAFTAQYDGNTDVYIIPTEGGSPERLTWHPSADVVQGWTPDNQVLFRSSREAHPTTMNRLFTVGMQGGFPKAVDVPRAAYGEISPDGKHIAYVPITFWDPEWRNYRGGQAMPIWIVDLATKDLIRTPQPTKERHLDPVWFGEEVFFLSERDYASNIWAFNPKTKAERQITKHARFDTKSLDACSDAIVYEMGGYLHLLDPKTGNSKQLEIHVKGDMNFARTRWEDVKGNALSNARISPNGKRALFEHRGEIFTVPKEKGDWRNISNTPGIAERFPSWSPEGDKIAWFSDASGEYQLEVIDQKGLGEKKSYALPNPTFYFRPQWSKDGLHISYTDTDYNLWFVNLETGNATKVDTDRYAHPNRTLNPVWSPDGKWIAYEKQLDSHFKAIFAYNIDSKEKIQLTDGMADATSPSWDESGKYLYFMASTNYGLNSGWLDMSSYDPNVSRQIYMLILSKDEASPLLPKSDDEEVKEEKKEEKEEEDKKEEKKEEEISIIIDTENLSRRILALDIPIRNYAALFAGPKNSFFYSEFVPNENGFQLHKYDLEKQEAKVFLKGLNTAIPSHNRKSILYRMGGSWGIVDAAGQPKPGDGKLKINLRIKVDPQAEYQQIFKEGWRFQRDFLYVENVHGAPWDKVYEWYQPWVKHVRHRRDLNYLVDILSGEVSIGHSYVSGGDMPDVDFVNIGLLGADFEIVNNHYRIKKIYTGESWNPNIKAPLASPGMDIAEGDVIMAVNGKSLNGSDNIYSFFEETAGRQTILTIANGHNYEYDTKEVVVVPTGNEYMLRTFNWIESNRKKVDELSNGKLAYVYVPNTGGSGFTYFNRYYFAQQDKKGVVIDERNNGGGSAADYMIDIMSRKLFGYFNSKAGDKRPWTTPIAGIWGPKVMIINERAGSGGDLLPYMFRDNELGPLIGTRTWGGLVGTWDTPRFIDGGRMIAPRGGFFDADGNWAVEGEGIAPDIEVIQEPKLVMQGQDPQLERAIKEALKLLETEEVIHKKEPAAPVRWKRPKGY